MSMTKLQNLVYTLQIEKVAKTVITTSGLLAIFTSLDLALLKCQAYKIAVQKSDTNIFCINHFVHLVHMHIDSEDLIPTAEKTKKKKIKEIISRKKRPK